MKTKRVVGMALSLVILSSACYAISFTQPQEIGSFSFVQGGKGAGGIRIENASRNKGDYFTQYNKNNSSSYGKGVASFGNGDDALYVHYDVYQKVGGLILAGNKDIKNTYSVGVLNQVVDIIKSDGGITIYPIISHYGPEKDYVVLGRQKDGKFVKYFDTESITNNHFGMGRNGMPPVVYTKLAVAGDTLVLYYSKAGMPARTAGELRFKWDDKAQWFGVEKIVY
ncbi:MAG: hypothetical protein IKZ43_01160 [Acidaminococcaceae bacterium]|nr:hypothetical protein [Acidaminococcaceae bacterium]